MISRDLIDSYVLEVISRAESVRGKCEYLLTMEYSSKTPKDLARTIINACEFLKKAVSGIYTEGKLFEHLNPDDFELIKYIDLIIKMLGEHIAHIDRARTENTKICKRYSW